MSSLPNRRRIPALAAALVLGSATLTGGVLTATAVPAEPSDSTRQLTDTEPKPRKVADRETATVQLDYATGKSSVSQRITRPGAGFLKLHITGFKLAPGDYLTVSDPKGRQKLTYHSDPTKYRHTGNSPHTVEGPGFWAMTIDGDTAIVTVRATAKRDADQLRGAGYGVRIGGLYRGYGEAEQTRKDKEAGLDSVCSADARRDAICYQSSHPTEYARSRAVAKQFNPGGSMCTAWRVGRTNRVLTNNHCIDSQADVSGTELWFNYACRTCGGNDPGTTTRVSGATFYRTSAALDYTLYSVNNFSSISSFGYLLLDNRAPRAGERIYISGHGSGRPNQLSIYEDSQGGAACNIDSTALDANNIGYYCDTTGGSSGSPVLAGSSHRVIALHHWGGCLNGGVRIDRIYPQIASQIDNT